METGVDHDHWDLQDLIPDRQKNLESTLEQIESCLHEIEAYRPQLTTNLPINHFLNVLHLQEKLHSLGAKAGAYAYLRFAENTQDPDALSLEGKVEQILTDVENRAMFFDLWFKSLSDEEAERFIAAAGDLSYYLEATRRFKPYTLSEPEEKIINLKDVNGIMGLIKIYEIITNGFKFHLEVDGEVKELTRDGLTSYYHHPSPEVRAATYQELYRVYIENKTALSQIYAYIARDWHAEGIDLRGYAAPISSRNLSNQVPDAVVNTLLQVCQQNTGVFQRYFQIKAKMLGIPKLRRYDIYAPIAASEKEFEFHSAVDLVLDCFKKFSPQVAQAASQVFAKDHLDAGVRQGKRGGAFCYTVTPDLVPWVLVNFSGKLRDVTTMAHELGHAVHGILASGHSVLNFHAPLPLAETASVFGEMLVTDRLLEEESDPAVQRDLLMTILDDAYATVQRQAFFSIFEKEAHASIADGCTSEELAQKYLQNLRLQFGDAVELSDEFAWEWISIPHIFNTPFYCYAYSFGQLLVLALYQQYLNDPEHFLPRYLKLLSYGGSAEPVGILAEAGLNIASPGFWQGGFDVLQDRLDRLSKITGGLP
jgi:oligoendopeptidase F